MTNENAVIARHYLDQALALLRPYAGSKTDADNKAKDLDGALSAALKLCKQNHRTGAAKEPLRTVHHLSCTGGTLIAKCIASMANVLLLNEIDYSSPLVLRRSTPVFSPTDLISLIKQGDENADLDLILQLFVHDIMLLLNRQAEIGRSVVLRDHSHSHFLTTSAILDEPTLYETARSHFDVKSLVSVRDPVDSYASMVLRKWHLHFLPSTFDEYCRRYLIFLDRHAGIPVIRYEDFVADPKKIMREICRILALDYVSDFLYVFDSFAFSGDSGRKGAIIKPRKLREIMPELQSEIVQSTHYVALCRRLEYEPR